MKKKTKAKKPRTLNAVWADAAVYVERDGHRSIHVWVDNDGPITAKQALRLSQWLTEAAAWKADE